MSLARPLPDALRHVLLGAVDAIARHPLDHEDVVELAAIGAIADPESYAVLSEHLAAIVMAAIDDALEERAHDAE